MPLAISFGICHFYQFWVEDFISEVKKREDLYRDLTLQCSNATMRSIDLPVELLFPFFSPFSLTELFVHFSLVSRKWHPNFVVIHIGHFQNYRICSSFSGNTVQRYHLYLKIRWRRNEKWEALYKNSNRKSK